MVEPGGPKIPDDSETDEFEDDFGLKKPELPAQMRMFGEVGKIFGDIEYQKYRGEKKPLHILRLEIDSAALVSFYKAEHDLYVHLKIYNDKSPRVLPNDESALFDRLAHNTPTYDNNEYTLFISSEVAPFLYNVELEYAINNGFTSQLAIQLFGDVDLERDEEDKLEDEWEKQHFHAKVLEELRRRGQTYELTNEECEEMLKFLKA